MDYQLWLGDCLEEMDRIDDGSVDAIVADWPYQQTACSWDSMIPLEPLWKQCKRVIKRNGVIVLTAKQPFTSILILNDLSLFSYELIWDKEFGVDWPSANWKPLSSHENILIFSRSKPTYNPQKVLRDKPRDRTGESGKAVWNSDHKLFNSKKWTGNKVYTDKYPLSVIRQSSQAGECNNTKKLHSTQKPVALLEYLIKTYTNEGDLVLDNTFGSCSTGEACLRTNRRFIGIERDPNYFEIGKARMERVAAELRGELTHLPMFQEIAA